MPASLACGFLCIYYGFHRYTSQQFTWTSASRFFFCSSACAFASSSTSLHDVVVSKKTVLRLKEVLYYSFYLHLDLQYTFFFFFCIFQVFFPLSWIASFIKLSIFPLTWNATFKIYQGTGHPQKGPERPTMATHGNCPWKAIQLTLHGFPGILLTQKFQSWI